MAILTISRQYGSGGREIARTIAGRLGYRYEDRVTLLAALRTSNPGWERFGDEYDERRPSLWERFDWSYAGFSALLQRHLLEAAAADRVVIVGRGAAFLLAGVPTALHVRIVGPLAARIERIMRREQADHDSVRRLIERVDRERAGFIQAIYRRSWDDPAAYDVTYDTSLLEPPAIVDNIIARLGERDRGDGAAARRILDRRLVAARVRGALFTDPHLQLPTLEVLADDAGVVVRGVLHSPEQLARIQSSARGQAGGYPVRFELRYR